MTDDIIERYTGTTRISSFSVFIATQIVRTGRYTPIFLDECVHDRIELEGRHSCTDILRDHIEGTGRELRSFTDSCYLFWSFDEDL